MIHVAVGIIVNPKQEILIAQRPKHTSHGGLWEFPGGKVEAGETVYDALCRELKEELSLEVLSAKPFTKVTYDYEEYGVLLDTWIVDGFSGEPFGVEGQELRWIDLENLKEMPMPEANKFICKKLYATAGQIK